MDNILMDLHNSSHPTQPHSIIAKCFPSPICISSVFNSLGSCNRHKRNQQASLCIIFEEKPDLHCKSCKPPKGKKYEILNLELGKVVRNAG